MNIASKPRETVAALRMRFNSIAVKLALWYALSAFGLVLAATGSLYWALKVNLDREDAMTLENHLQDLRLLLSTSSPGKPFAASTVNRFSYQTKQDVFVRLIDGQGAVVFETPGMASLAPKNLFPQLTNIDRTRPLTLDIVTNEERRLHMIIAWAAIDSPAADRRQFQLAVDREDEELFLRKFRDIISLILIAAVLTCAFGGVLIARRGLLPVARITSAARDTKSATLNKRLVLDGLPNELADLGTSFNAMLDRLEDAFGRMSQFSADVAHELRTPIANLRGEIEVALGKPRSPAEYQDVLGSNLEECERLTRIIQSLLFLSKAEIAPQLNDYQRVDLTKTISNVVEFYETTAADASVTLQAELVVELWGNIDRTLMQQAVGNLISNAITYTPAGGTVIVALAQAGADAKISVTDTGTGIAPHHLPHVFDRFYRADWSRTGSTQHVGLGLTLVQSIARLHGGTAEIVSNPGQGTCVTVQFPLDTDLEKQTTAV